MDSSLGRTNFSNDPTYQAALQAAARSSVLAATSGLGSLALGAQPPPPPPGPSGRTFSSDATPPPKPPPPPPPPRQLDSAAAPAPSGPVTGSEGHGSSGRGHGSGDGGGGGGKEAKAQAEPGQQLGRRSSGPRPAAEGGNGREGPAAAAAAAVAGTPPPAAPAAAAPPAPPSGGAKGAMARSGSGSGRGGGGGGGGGGGREAAREAAPARFPEYLPQEDLQRGLKSGQLFRGKVRVNPGDRREAYVSVPGLPHDLLLRGEAAQNRVLEGDEVAVALQPVTAWFTVKRLAGAGADREQTEPKESASSSSAAAGMPPQLAAQLAADEAPWRSATSPQAVRDLVGAIAAARPELRVTAKVVGLLEPSPKRQHIVGLLQFAEAAPPPQLQPSSSQQTASATGASTSTSSASTAAPTPDSSSMPEGSVAPLGVLPTCYLLPLDPRMPRCVVRPGDVRNLPPALIRELRAGERAESRTLMSACIAEWTSAHIYPCVTLRASLGQAGEIEPETAAILEMEGIRTGDFSPEVLACLPPTPWSISPEELAKRRDFRSTRVFSIDPPTAKDLDDALSIQSLPPSEGGGWRVGVHIADVAHFITPYSALDVEAGLRGTSTYLVQRVIPMLPPLLCEELCSLNPGVERLAFSVVWDMDGEGNVRSTWFGRSVIRSCAKLSYPLVQAMIEDRFDQGSCPVALHGDGVSWDQVIGDSLSLWSIAKRLRARRFEGGALRLDNTRLHYQLDKEGNPVSAAPYVQQEANQLVEEFMLLANMSVAEAISKTFPDRALLRRHEPPLPNKLKVLQEAAEAAGLPIDTSSAGAIQAGLNEIRNSLAEAETAAAAAGGGAGAAAAADLEARRHQVELLVMLATRPMVLAEYFCTGLAVDEITWRHYALAVPAYTHFTSPIRRYPDVVVHRLLAAALEARQRQAEGGAGGGGAAAAEAAAKHRLLDTRLTGLVAEHCNTRRLAARNAQDASLRLYLCVLLKRHPVVTTGTVCNVGGDRYFGAYLPEFGQEIRIEISEVGVPVAPYWNPGSKTLVLSRGSAAAAAEDGGGGGGQRNGGGSSQFGRERRGGFGAAGGGGRRGGGGGEAAASGTAADAPDLASWISALPPVRNPRGLRPAGLPLSVALFADVPVVVTAVTPAGEPSRLVARLFLQEALDAMEAKEAAAPAPVAAAAVEGPAVRESEIPIENLVMD